MARWVALLRGVNVNGITIRSADLAELFRTLGFTDVRTVLASGNVVFSAEAEAEAEAEAAAAAAPVTDDAAAPDAHDARAALRSRIESGLRERFGYDAWIVLVAHDDLAGIVDGYPFPEDADTHAYVVFTSDDAARAELLAVPTNDVERIAPGAGVVYWACPKGSSTDTPFAKTAGKARFKATTTTRNLNTLRKTL
jgi:uncharacterized protein (DUF1697 family)